MGFGLVLAGMAVGIPPRGSVYGQQSPSSEILATGINCNADTLGIAFDGRALLTSCEDPGTNGRILATDPRSGAPLGFYRIDGIDAISGLSWDPGRRKLWACAGSTFGTVELVDLGRLSHTPPAIPTGGAQPVFTIDQQASGGRYGCDALAYDAFDDTLWVNAQTVHASENTPVQHYTTAGHLLSSSDVQLQPAQPRGLAVVGSSLYYSALRPPPLAHNWIFQSTKDMTNQNQVVQYTGKPAFSDDGDFDFAGIVCDDISFRGTNTTVFWVRDDDSGDLMAFPIGTGVPCGPPPPSYTLTVAVAGTGDGSVASIPAGIACGNGGSACTQTFAPGTTVHLGLTRVRADSYFAGWSGDCSTDPCTVTMDQNRAVTATFNLLPGKHPPPPPISVSDVTLGEPPTGVTVTANFTVSMSAASPITLTADYATSDGSAVAPDDYTAVTGTLTFPPGGLLSQTVSVPVIGDDDAPQPATKFFLVLTASTATLAGPVGTATIRDDGGAVIGSAGAASRDAATLTQTVSGNGPPGGANQLTQQAQNQAQSQSQAQAQAQAQVQAQTQAQAQTATQVQPALMLERERQIELERATISPHDMGGDGWSAVAWSRARNLAGTVVVVSLLAGAEWIRQRQRHRLPAVERERGWYSP